MKLTDIITSPKLITGGRGAWEGPLGELIGWETNRWEGTALGMIQAGRLTQAEWEAEDFDLANYAGRMTLEDVRNLADDPNAEVRHDRFPASGDTITSTELVARREALGLSQQALGEAIGVKQPTISAWEIGTRSIPDGVANEIAALEDLQDDLVDRIIDLVEGHSAKLNTPEVTWDQQEPPENVPAGLVTRALVLAARDLRQENEITLRF